MQHLPTDWAALCGVVLLLGMRHGLDADHLAAIDGLTRLSSRDGRRYARFCGSLFSLGHGAVVLTIAAGTGLLGNRWMPPTWLDTVGSLISISVLATLGAMNVLVVLKTPPNERVNLVGIRSRAVRLLLGRTDGARGPAAALGVGAMFALSFDTLSQSALFAIVATRFGGPEHCLALGALFVVGMLLSDGGNGWWMSLLIQRTDQAAAVASRTMTVAVAAISLLIAGFELARLVSEHVAAWGDGKELALGLAVALVAGVSYLLALALSRMTARSRNARL